MENKINVFLLPHSEFNFNLISTVFNLQGEKGKKNKPWILIECAYLNVHSKYDALLFYIKQVI